VEASGLYGVVEDVELVIGSLTSFLSSGVLFDIVFSVALLDDSAGRGCIPSCLLSTMFLMAMRAMVLMRRDSSFQTWAPIISCTVGHVWYHIFPWCSHSPSIYTTRLPHMFYNKRPYTAQTLRSMPCYSKVFLTNPVYQSSTTQIYTAQYRTGISSL
jgi:hypothetical protein